MNKRIYISIMLSVLLGFFCADNAFSWDDKITHPLLGKYAAESSVLGMNNGDFLKRLGFSNGLNEIIGWNNKKFKIIEWIAEGETLEDAGELWEVLGNRARFNNARIEVARIEVRDRGSGHAG